MVRRIAISSSGTRFQDVTAIAGLLRSQEASSDPRVVRPAGSIPPAVTVWRQPRPDPALMIRWSFKPRKLSDERQTTALLRKLTAKNISTILWNPKIYYRVYKSPLSAPILSHVYPLRSPSAHFINIHFNIIFPSTPRFCKWSLVHRIRPSMRLCLTLFIFIYIGFLR